MKQQVQLVVVGGPNGSGKTTFARSYAQSEGLCYLGADDIAFEWSPHSPAQVKVATRCGSPSRGTLGMIQSAHFLNSGTTMLHNVVTGGCSC